MILEVGLGGRLDAVNAIDADVAIVTSVDIDHEAFLGSTREAIGREKAGVYRGGRVAVCGDADPPASLVAHAEAIGAKLQVLGRDFEATGEGTQWRYRGPGGDRYGLPPPALRGDYQLGNAACAIAALDALRARLPVDGGALRAGLVGVELPGRFQVLPGRPTRVLDVAHNPQAARALARTLGAMGYHPRTIAVAAMLADKDVDAVVAALRERVDRWHVAPLPPPRGASAERIAEALAHAGVDAGQVVRHGDVGAAWRAARAEAVDADRIVAFGSFLTIAAVLEVERAERGSISRSLTRNRWPNPRTSTSTNCADGDAGASSAPSCWRSSPPSSCRCCSKAIRAPWARTSRCASRRSTTASSSTS